MFGCRPLAAFLAVTSSLVILTGCSAGRFGYGGVMYPSRAEAFQAARSDLGATVSAVTPTRNRIGGSVLVVVPSREALQAYGRALIRRSGAPPRSLAADDASGFLADVLEMSSLATVDILRQGRVFDDILVERSENPGPASSQGAGHTLWLLLREPSSPQDVDTAQWFLSKPGTPARERVRADPTVEHRERGNSFNRSVIEAATRL